MENLSTLNEKILLNSHIKRIQDYFHIHNQEIDHFYLDRNRESCIIISKDCQNYLNSIPLKHNLGTNLKNYYKTIETINETCTIPFFNYICTIQFKSHSFNNLDQNIVHFYLDRNREIYYISNIDLK